MPKAQNGTQSLPKRVGIDLMATQGTAQRSTFGDAAQMPELLRDVKRCAKGGLTARVSELLSPCLILSHPNS